MGSHEGVHWGQCFEEFYGPDYCKNLRKDLEKLKDEFYDGNSQRFQREWVMPTVNLLRRLRHMGFPIRSALHVIIHLYNPVDSMFAGEMHFQVGRKVPGTVTLKFTKQNTVGVYVIQPKTLSLNDEIQLNSDPMELMNKVRLEMKESCIDTASLLQTLVLMTDTCKLERVSFKTVFSDAPVLQNTPYLQLSSIPPDSSMYPQKSIPLIAADNNWGMCIQPPLMLDSMATIAGQPDKTFQAPWNLCVKNYVNYNGHDKKPEVVINGLARGPDKVQSDSRNDHHLLMGTVYRQSRSSTWHSEPEENDETMDFRSSNEDCCGGSKGSLPSANIDDVEAKMANASLWNPPPKLANNMSKSVTLQNPGNNRKLSSETVDTGAYNWSMQMGIQNVNSIDNCEQYLEKRTSLTDEYAGDQRMELLARQRSASGTSMDINHKASQEVLRRNSEPRTRATEEYFSERRQVGGEYRVPYKGHLRNEHVVPAKDCGVEKQYDLHNKNASVPNNNRPMPGQVTATNSKSPRSMTKTETIDEYAGINKGNQALSGFAHSELDQSLLENYSNFEGRRTSSLDSYVGSTDESTPSERMGNTTESGHCALQTYNVNECVNNNPFLASGDNCSQPGSFEANAGGSLPFSSPMNVPNISLLHNYQSRTASVGSVHVENLDSIPSWTSHVPVSRFEFDGSPDRRRFQLYSQTPSDSRNASLLSQDSFASWRSHLNGERPRINVLPATIEEINHNVQIWQKSALPNT